MKLRARSGFTLVELLVVLFGIALLAGIVITQYQYVPIGRDTQRIETLQNLKSALTLYYQQYKHYPPACGTDYGGYSYYPGPCSSQGVAISNLLFSDSVTNLLADAALVGQGNPEMSLYDSNMFTDKTWNDPLTGPAPVSADKKFNCRYVIDGTNVTCTNPSTYKSIQKYYLHCALERKLAISNNASDGGHDWLGDLYEVYEPNPWIGCLYYGN